MLHGSSNQKLDVPHTLSIGCSQLVHLLSLCSCHYLISIIVLSLAQGWQLVCWVCPQRDTRQSLFWFFGHLLYGLEREKLTVEAKLGLNLFMTSLIACLDMDPYPLVRQLTLYPFNQDGSYNQLVCSFQPCLRVLIELVFFVMLRD